MAGNIGTAVYRIIADAKALEDAFKKAENDAKRSGTAAGAAFSQGVDAGVKSPNFRSPVARGLAGAEEEMRRSGGKMSSIMNGIFQGIGQGIAGTLTSAISGAVGMGINAIKGMASTVYEVGTNAEQLKIAFTTIIGDAKRADKLLQDMRTFAAKTPYTSTEVQKSSQKLLGVVAPDDMIRTLTRLGDVAAGTKSNLGEITTIYQQVLSKGRVQAEESIQFAERGILVQKEMAKVLGVTEAEYLKLQAAGKVSSDVLVKAFANMADEGGKFNGIMEKQSKTLAGLASTMKDNFEQTAGKIYTAVNPALVAMIKSFDEAGQKASKNNNLLGLMSDIAAGIAKWFSQHQTLVDRVFIAITRMTESGLREALKVTKDIYGWLQKNPAVMNAIVTQVRLWGSGIRIVYDGLKSLAPIFGEIVKFCAQILDYFNIMGAKIQELVGGASKLGEALMSIPQSLGITANGQQAAANTRDGVNTDAAVEGGRYLIDGGSQYTVDNSRKHHDYQTSKDGSGRMVKDLTISQGGRTNVNTPSPTAGKVLQSTMNGGGYGGKIVIQEAGTSGKENQVLIGHLQKLYVKVGDVVARGQHVGMQGGGLTDPGRGNTTGRHLHIEARKEVLAKYYNSLNSNNWGQYARNASNSDNAKGFLSGKSRNDQKEENIRGFAQAIALGETNMGKDVSTTAGNKGIFQNNDKDIRYFSKEYPEYAPMSNNGSFESQLNAVRAGLKFKGALKDVEEGNFASANRKANSFWVSLPGGSQQSNKWKGRNINDFMPGNKSFIPNWNPQAGGLGKGGATPAELKAQEAAAKRDVPKTLAEREAGAAKLGSSLKSTLDEAKREEVKKKKEKADREAAKKKQEAEKIRKDSEAREEAINEAKNAVTDSDLARLEALAEASQSPKLKQSVDVRRVEVKLQRDLAENARKTTKGELNPTQGRTIENNLKQAATARISAIKTESKKAVGDEDKRRADVLTQAQREVAKSKIDQLDALADATEDLTLKASVERQRIQQELEAKLAGLRSQVTENKLSPIQARDIEKNYRSEAKSRTDQVNTRLAKDLGDKAKTKADEAKRKAEEDKQKGIEQKQKTLEAQENIAAQSVEILKLQASLSDDLSLALNAELQSIQAEYQRAVNQVDIAVAKGDKSITQGNAEKGNLAAAMKLRQQKAQQDSDNKQLEIEDQARKLQAAKGAKIQEAIKANTQAGYDRQDTAVGTAGVIANSDLDLLRSKAERVRDPEKKREANIAVGQTAVRIDLMNQLQQIEQIGRSGNYSAEQLNKMKQNAEAMATIKLDAVQEQFLTLGQTIQRDLTGSFGQFLQSFITGSQSITEAAGSMFAGIASNLAQMGISRLLGGIFGGGGVTAFAKGTESGGRKFTNIADAMNYEKQTSGRKPILAVLHEGEAVIPAKQIDGMKSVTAFARGTTGMQGTFRGGNNINLGNITIPVNGGGISNSEAERLREMVKTSVYGIITHETRSGGMFNKGR